MRTWLADGDPWADTPGEAPCVAMDLRAYLRQVEEGRPRPPAIVDRLRAYWRAQPTLWEGVA